MTATALDPGDLLEIKYKVGESETFRYFFILNPATCCIMNMFFFVAVLTMEEEEEEVEEAEEEGGEEEEEEEEGEEEGGNDAVGVHRGHVRTRINRREIECRPLLEKHD